MLKNLKLYSCFFFLFFNAFSFSSFLQLILLQHVDVDVNPGPRKAKLNRFSCCHRNVNSLISHNMAKLSQIEAYNSIYKFDMICISETYFEETYLLETEEFSKTNRAFIRADHPSNTKRGVVCINYKESLGVKVLDVSFKIEYILCEVMVQSKRGCVAVMYRSPSQNNTAFDDFLTSFDNLLNIVDRSTLFQEMNVQLN